MSRDTCRLPSCENEPGEVDDADTDYRSGRFCSPEHDLKYEHLKADARDARDARREVGR